jgi:predicted dehydrogenase
VTDQVRIGMLGSGFIADFYVTGSRLAPDAVIVANYARPGSARGPEFASRHGIARTYDSIEALCADPEVDLVIVALPNHLHLPAVRAREGHSGPHAAHFWDAATAGGGAMLDMGCHGIETARILFGKDQRVRDVFMWGGTLVHGGRTAGEDNGILLMRYEDGRVATIEASWSAKGGIDVRIEAYGTTGRIVNDSTVTPIKAFIAESAGYLAEKTDADTGWVFPVADEPRVHGYDEMVRHFVTAYRDGVAPRKTFDDGYIVNAIVDAGYRSMRSGVWEPLVLERELVAA